MRRKIISIILIISFISTNFNFSFADYNVETGQRPVSCDSRSFSFGKIADTYVAGSRHLYIIQDAHCNKEVQENIVSILKEIDEINPNSELIIGQEGSTKKIDNSLISNIKNTKARHKVLNHLFDNGYITGAELFGINNPKAHIYGIEDESLYKNNFKYLCKALNYNRQFDGLFKTLKEIIHRAKELIYWNKDLKLLEIKQAEYEEGHIDLINYINYLVSFKKNIKIYKNISIFVKANKLIKGIDRSKIKVEAEYLVTRIVKKIDMKDRESLKKSKGSEYYLLLSNIIDKYRIKLPQDFRNLQKYLQYIKYLETKNDIELKEELDQLLTRIKKSFVQGKEIVARVEYCDRLLKVLEAVLNIEATDKDYELWKKEQKKFYKEINTLCNQFSYKNHFKDYSQKIKQATKIITNFYTLANKRNELIVKNILTHIVETGQWPVSEGGDRAAVDKPNNESFYNKRIRRATDSRIYNHIRRATDPSLQYDIKEQKALSIIPILIIGGYHTNGITQILRTKNISYTVITPRITKTTNSKQIYLERIKEQAQVLNFPIQGNLNPTPTNIAIMNAYESGVLNEAKLKQIFEELNIKDEQALFKALFQIFKGQEDITQVLLGYRIKEVNRFLIELSLKRDAFDEVRADLFDVIEIGFSTIKFAKKFSNESIQFIKDTLEFIDSAMIAKKNDKYIIFSSGKMYELNTKFLKISEIPIDSSDIILILEQEKVEDIYYIREIFDTIKNVLEYADKKIIEDSLIIHLEILEDFKETQKFMKEKNLTCLASIEDFKNIRDHLLSLLRKDTLNEFMEYFELVRETHYEVFKHLKKNIFSKKKQKTSNMDFEDDLEEEPSKKELIRQKIREKANLIANRLGYKPLDEYLREKRIKERLEGKQLDFLSKEYFKAIPKTIWYEMLTIQYIKELVRVGVLGPLYMMYPKNIARMAILIFSHFGFGPSMSDLLEVRRNIVKLGYDMKSISKERSVSDSKEPATLIDMPKLDKEYIFYNGSNKTGYSSKNEFEEEELKKGYSLGGFLRSIFPNIFVEGKKIDDPYIFPQVLHITAERLFGAKRVHVNPIPIGREDGFKGRRFDVYNSNTRKERMGIYYPKVRELIIDTEYEHRIIRYNEQEQVIYNKEVLDGQIVIVEQEFKYDENFKLIERMEKYVDKEGNIRTYEAMWEEFSEEWIDTIESRERNRRRKLEEERKAIEAQNNQDQNIEVIEDQEISENIPDESGSASRTDFVSYMVKRIEDQLKKIWNYKPFGGVKTQEVKVDRNSYIKKQVDKIYEKYKPKVQGTFEEYKDGEIYNKKNEKRIGSYEVLTTNTKKLGYFKLIKKYDKKPSLEIHIKYRVDEETAERIDELTNNKYIFKLLDVDNIINVLVMNDGLEGFIISTNKKPYWITYNNDKTGYSATMYDTNMDKTIDSIEEKMGNMEQEGIYGIDESEIFDNEEQGIWYNREEKKVADIRKYSTVKRDVENIYDKLKDKFLRDYERLDDGKIYDKRNGQKIGSYEIIGIKLIKKYDDTPSWEFVVFLDNLKHNKDILDLSGRELKELEKVNNVRAYNRSDFNKIKYIRVVSRYSIDELYLEISYIEDLKYNELYKVEINKGIVNSYIGMNYKGSYYRLFENGSLVELTSPFKIKEAYLIEQYKNAQNLERPIMEYVIHPSEEKTKDLLFVTGNINKDKIDKDAVLMDKKFLKQSQIRDSEIAVINYLIKRKKEFNFFINFDIDYGKLKLNMFRFSSKLIEEISKLGFILPYGREKSRIESKVIHRLYDKNKIVKMVYVDDKLKSRFIRDKEKDLLFFYGNEKWGGFGYDTFILEYSHYDKYLGLHKIIVNDKAYFVNNKGRIVRIARYRVERDGKDIVEIEEDLDGEVSVIRTKISEDEYNIEDGIAKLQGLKQGRIKLIEYIEKPGFFNRIVAGIKSKLSTDNLDKSGASSRDFFLFRWFQNVWNYQFFKGVKSQKVKVELDNTGNVIPPEGGSGDKDKDEGKEEVDIEELARVETVEYDGKSGEKVLLTISKTNGEVIAKIEYGDEGRLINESGDRIKKIMLNRKGKEIYIDCTKRLGTIEKGFYYNVYHDDGKNLGIYSFDENKIRLVLTVNRDQEEEEQIVIIENNLIVINKIGSIFFGTENESIFLIAIDFSDISDGQKLKNIIYVIEEKEGKVLFKYLKGQKSRILNLEDVKNSQDLPIEVKQYIENISEETRKINIIGHVLEHLHPAGDLDISKLKNEDKNEEVCESVEQENIEEKKESSSDVKDKKKSPVEIWNDGILEVLAHKGEELVKDYEDKIRNNDEFFQDGMIYNTKSKQIVGTYDFDIRLKGAKEDWFIMINKKYEAEPKLWITRKFKITKEIDNKALTDREKLDLIEEKNLQDETVEGLFSVEYNNGKKISLRYDGNYIAYSTKGNRILLDSSQEKNIKGLRKHLLLDSDKFTSKGGIGKEYIINSRIEEDAFIEELSFYREDKSGAHRAYKAMCIFNQYMTPEQSSKDNIATVKEFKEKQFNKSHILFSIKDIEDNYTSIRQNFPDCKHIGEFVFIDDDLDSKLVKRENAQIALKKFLLNKGLLDKYSLYRNKKDSIIYKQAEKYQRSKYVLEKRLKPYKDKVISIYIEKQGDSFILRKDIFIDNKLRETYFTDLNTGLTGSVFHHMISSNQFTIEYINYDKNSKMHKLICNGRLYYVDDKGEVEKADRYEVIREGEYIVEIQEEQYRKISVTRTKISEDEYNIEDGIAKLQSLKKGTIPIILYAKKSESFDSIVAKSRKNKKELSNESLLIRLGKSIKYVIDTLKNKKQEYLDNNKKASQALREVKIIEERYKKFWETEDILDEARLHKEYGRYYKAMEVYKKARGLMYGEIDFFLDMAECYEGLKNYDESFEYIKKAKQEEEYKKLSDMYDLVIDPMESRINKKMQEKKSLHNVETGQKPVSRNSRSLFVSDPEVYNKFLPQEIKDVLEIIKGYGIVIHGIINPQASETVWSGGGVHCDDKKHKLIDQCLEDSDHGEYMKDSQSKIEQAFKLLYEKGLITDTILVEGFHYDEDVKEDSQDARNYNGAIFAGKKYPNLKLKGTESMQNVQQIEEIRQKLTELNNSYELLKDMPIEEAIKIYRARIQYLKRKDYLIRSIRAKNMIDAATGNTGLSQGEGHNKKLIEDPEIVPQNKRVILMDTTFLQNQRTPLREWQKEELIFIEFLMSKKLKNLAESRLEKLINENINILEAFEVLGFNVIRENSRIKIVPQNELLDKVRKNDKVKVEVGDTGNAIPPGDGSDDGDKYKGKQGVDLVYGKEKNNIRRKIYYGEKGLEQDADGNRIEGIQYFNSKGKEEMYIDYTQNFANYIVETGQRPVSSDSRSLEGKIKYEIYNKKEGEKRIKIGEELTAEKHGATRAVVVQKKEGRKKIQLICWYDDNRNIKHIKQTKDKKDIEIEFTAKGKLNKKDERLLSRLTAKFNFLKEEKEIIKEEELVETDVDNKKQIKNTQKEKKNNKKRKSVLSETIEILKEQHKDLGDLFDDLIPYIDNIRVLGNTKDIDPLTVFFIRYNHPLPHIPKKLEEVVEHNEKILKIMEKLRDHSNVESVIIEQEADGKVFNPKQFKEMSLYGYPNVYFHLNNQANFKLVGGEDSDVYKKALNVYKQMIELELRLFGKEDWSIDDRKQVNRLIELAREFDRIGIKERNKNYLIRAEKEAKKNPNSIACVIVGGSHTAQHSIDSKMRIVDLFVKGAVIANLFETSIRYRVAGEYRRIGEDNIAIEEYKKILEMPDIKLFIKDREIGLMALYHEIVNLSNIKHKASGDIIELYEDLYFFHEDNWEKQNLITINKDLLFAHYIMGNKEDMIKYYKKLAQLLPHQFAELKDHEIRNLIIADQGSDVLKKFFERYTTKPLENICKKVKDTTCSKVELLLRQGAKQAGCELEYIEAELKEREERAIKGMLYWDKINTKCMIEKTKHKVLEFVYNLNPGLAERLIKEEFEHEKKELKYGSHDKAFEEGSEKFKAFIKMEKVFEDLLEERYELVLQEDINKISELLEISREELEEKLPKLKDKQHKKEGWFWKGINSAFGFFRRQNDSGKDKVFDYDETDRREVMKNLQFYFEEEQKVEDMSEEELSEELEKIKKLSKSIFENDEKSIKRTYKINGVRYLEVESVIDGLVITYRLDEKGEIVDVVDVDRPVADIKLMKMLLKKSKSLQKNGFAEVLRITNIKFWQTFVSHSWYSTRKILLTTKKAIYQIPTYSIRELNNIYTAA